MNLAKNIHIVINKDNESEEAFELESQARAFMCNLADDGIGAYMIRTKQF